MEGKPTIKKLKAYMKEKGVKLPHGYEIKKRAKKKKPAKR